MLNNSVIEQNAQTTDICRQRKQCPTPNKVDIKLNIFHSKLIYIDIHAENKQK